jgi:uracil-DNA glycosylase family 4
MATAAALSPLRRARLFARVQDDIRACRRCEALVRCRTQPVPGAGEVPARIVFVGIAPGRFGGDRTGTPFSGDRSGKLLREMITHAGLERVFITNLVRCNPRDERGRNRDPDAAEISNCRDHLTRELELTRPHVVVCLGRMAWRELAGATEPFDPMHPVPARLNGAIVYPMYHPAYVNRGAYSVRSYRRDFRRLARLIDAAMQR